MAGSNSSSYVSFSSEELSLFFSLLVSLNCNDVLALAQFVATTDDKSSSGNVIQSIMSVGVPMDHTGKPKANTQ